MERKRELIEPNIRSVRLFDMLLNPPYISRLAGIHL